MTHGSGAVTIRDAEPRDLARLVEFNLLLARSTEHLELDPATLHTGVDAVLTDPERGRYFVAELDGRVVGQTLITYEWSDWRNCWLWWLQSVYVEETCRGRGVFTGLYRHIERLARGASTVGGIRLYVEGLNQAAKDVYSRLGFSATGHLVYGVEF